MPPLKIVGQYWDNDVDNDDNVEDDVDDDDDDDGDNNGDDIIVMIRITIIIKTKYL